MRAKGLLFATMLLLAVPVVAQQPIGRTGGTATVTTAANDPLYVRLTDGTTAQTFAVFDADSGGGTANRVGVMLAFPASGGPAGVTGFAVGSTNAISVAIVDGSGNQITSFGGSGGTAMVDDAAFTPATTQVTPAGAMFDDVSPDSVNEGDGGVVRMSANRNLYVTIRDAAGNERGLNIASDGSLAVTNPTPATATSYLAVRLTDGSNFLSQDTQGTHGTTWGTITSVTGGASLFNASTATPTDVGADGDAVLPWATRNGALNVVNRISDGTEVAANTGTISAATLRVTLATDDDVSDAATLFEANLVAHDAVDAGSPLKVGSRTVAFGATPTAVAAGDRADLLSNRAGIPFVQPGHPNIVTTECQVQDADGALTDQACVTVSAGTKIVVTGVGVNCDGSTTAPTNIAVGFGTANVPSRAHTGAAGILLGFDGVPAGGGRSKGFAGGIVGVGADDEDVRYTIEDPAGGNCSIDLAYYTIAS